MKTILNVAVVVIAVLCGAHARAEPSIADDIGQYLRSEMRDRHIPGLQVAVVKGGKIVMLKSYGVAELPHAVPVTQRSVFSINSATKSFTGVAIMQLVEQGKLDLSAPISRYLTDLPAPWQAVTVTRLLNHTSGLPDIVSQQTWQVAPASNWDSAWRQVQTMPVDFAPGERFSYNQTNYLLLGKIIDALSGQPFTRFISQRQFNAAGMRQTSFGDLQDVIPNKAPSYRLDADGKTLKLMVDDFPGFLRAGAGINTSAEDLAHWIIALQKGQLLSPAGLAQLWRRGQLSDGKAAPWALGWPVIRDKEYRTVGGMGGTRSAFYIYPEDDLAVVILTNLAGAAPEQMIDVVAGYFLPGLKKVSGGYATYRLRRYAQANGYARLDEQLATLTQRSGIARPSEGELNAWGYQLLGAGRIAPAVAVLGLTARLYPQSFNAHDSLAEGYEAAGEPVLAAQHYRRSLELNAKNTHAIDRLRALAPI
ncbi:serine hydrolase [Rugamonas sp. FT82W]|uniref:Serine hydrolase n=1 Tax=Duganella vulcania TaxID=2692166 RepID=A0A845G2E5_9BURK|nr:serine hydrolase domain-containing protein [Duganella vulcania]MYM87800.1 serine hydrolase [Duganella vulcania]